MGCQAGDTTPVLSQRGPGRAFGSGDTAGLGADAGLPTALRVLQHGPRRRPPHWSVPLGWGREALYGGGFWAPRGSSAGDSGMEMPLGAGRG